MIVVVGGHSRRTGKTAVVCAIIRGIPEARWTAIKLSPDAYGPPVYEETHVSRETGTGRYLEAGAVRSLLLSDAAALPKVLETTPAAIIESNSALHLVRPDLFVFVVNPTEPRKSGAEEYAGRADVLVIVGQSSPPEWAGGCQASFRVDPPEYSSGALLDFIRRRVGLSARE